MAKLRITYTKSSIGYSQDQKDTVRSLGLRKLNSTALHDDTPSIRGMAFKIRHLVKVEELADEEAIQPAKVAAVRPVKTALVATAAPKKPAATKAPAVAKAKPVAEPAIVDEPAVAATSVAEAPAVVETPVVA